MVTTRTLDGGFQSEATSPTLLAFTPSVAAPPAAPVTTPVVPGVPVLPGAPGGPGGGGPLREPVRALVEALGRGGAWTPSAGLSPVARDALLAVQDAYGPRLARLGADPASRAALADALAGAVERRVRGASDTPGLLAEVNGALSGLERRTAPGRPGPVVLRPGASTPAFETAPAPVGTPVTPGRPAATALPPLVAPRDGAPAPAPGASAAQDIARRQQEAERKEAAAWQRGAEIAVRPLPTARLDRIDALLGNGADPGLGLRLRESVGQAERLGRAIEVARANGGGQVVLSGESLSLASAERRLARLEQANARDFKTLEAGAGPKPAVTGTAPARASSGAFPQGGAPVVALPGAPTAGLPLSVPATGDPKVDGAVQKALEDINRQLSGTPLADRGALIREAVADLKARGQTNAAFAIESELARQGLGGPTQGSTGTQASNAVASGKASGLTADKVASLPVETLGRAVANLSPDEALALDPRVLEQALTRLYGVFDADMKPRPGTTSNQAHFAGAAINHIESIWRNQPDRVAARDGASRAPQPPVNPGVSASSSAEPPGALAIRDQVAPWVTVPASRDINAVSPLDMKSRPLSVTRFDSLGQPRDLTTGTYDEMPASTREQMRLLLKCANPSVYGAKTDAQIDELFRATTEVAAVTIAEPVAVAPGTVVKAPVTVPGGTVLPKGTILAEDVPLRNSVLKGGEPLQGDFTLPVGVILPKGTNLVNGLTLPAGTLGGSATMTAKMGVPVGSTDLGVFWYLGQVVGNPMLPGGGAQAFGSLVTEGRKLGRNIPAVTIDVNNFFNPFSDKPGVYHKAPRPDWGAVWIHDDKSGETQKNRQFFNFNNNDPGSLSQSPTERSIFAGQRQIVSNEVQQAFTEAGLDKLPSGTRLTFGWGQPPAFIWQNDSSQGLGDGTTWGYWQPVDPGKVDPATLPRPPRPDQMPRQNAPVPPGMPVPPAPGNDVPSVPNPGSVIPGQVGSMRPLTPQAPLQVAQPASQGSATPITLQPNGVNPREAGQNVVGEPAKMPVSPVPFSELTDQEVDVSLLNRENRQLWTNLTKAGLAASASRNVLQPLGNVAGQMIVRPILESRAGQEVIFAGGQIKMSADEAQKALGSTQLGQDLVAAWKATFGSPLARKALEVYEDSVHPVVVTAKNLTLALLATGMVDGSTKFHDFTVGPNMTPEQTELAKLVGLPNGYRLQVSVRDVPGMEELGGKAMIFSAEALAAVTPPGLPGQRGTAQPGFALAQEGKLPRNPFFATAAANGPTGIVGFRAGTPNFFVSEVRSKSVLSLAGNLPMVRLGSAVKQGPVSAATGSSSISVTNAADLAVAISAAPVRMGAQQRIGIGPVGFLVDRVVGPVRQTFDGGTGGVIMKPGTEVYSTIPGMVVGNTSFNPNAPDAKAAQEALTRLFRGADTQKSGEDQTKQP